MYPQSNFTLTAQPDSGCSPVKIDLLSEPGAFSYNWNFGDGQSIQGSNAISHIYENTGSTIATYSATLYSASVFGCLDTSSIDIKVNPSPVSKYSVTPTIGCAPLLVTFNNESENTTISLWKFGDGQEDTIPGDGSTDHIYLNSDFSQKTFKSVLVVENQFGCVDSSENFISVYPEVSAIIGTADSGCSPHEVSILNTSTGASEFYWDFGDGNTSSGFNGKNVYHNATDTAKTYNINFIAKSVYGCADTAFTSVDVFPSPTSKFSHTPKDGCAPVDVVFTNESGSVTSSIWKFGNGDEVTLPDDGSTSYTYENSGYAPDSYRVSLSVENSYGCADSTNSTLNIYPHVTASLSDGDDGCSPHDVTFTNSSVNANKFFWDYGDGNSSTQYSGFNTFTNTTNNDATYSVILTATSDYGCSDTDTTQVTVYRTPQPAFDVTPIEQQMPNSTVTITNNTPGSSWDYTWLWGDGKVSTAKDPDPYTYSFSGDYNIKLIVEGEHCADSTIKSIIILVLILF